MVIVRFAQRTSGARLNDSVTDGKVALMVHRQRGDCRVEVAKAASGTCGPVRRLT